MHTHTRNHTCIHIYRLMKLNLATFILFIVLFLHSHFVVIVIVSASFAVRLSRCNAAVACSRLISCSFLPFLLWGKGAALANLYYALFVCSSSSSSLKLYRAINKHSTRARHQNVPKTAKAEANKKKKNN